MVDMSMGTSFHVQAEEFLDDASKSKSVTSPSYCGSALLSGAVNSNSVTSHAYSPTAPSPNEGKSFQLGNDLTMIPKQLDTQFEKFGNVEKYGGALRSTVIKIGECWTKKSKPNILSSPESTFLESKEHKEEKDKALDLLDALSRSGSLPITCAELHVIVASTHCFKKSVMNTVVQDNINPIEKIERSNLLVASVIHGVNVGELLQDKTQLSRITGTSPYLLAGDDMALLN